MSQWGAKVTFDNFPSPLVIWEGIQVAKEMAKSDFREVVYVSLFN
jgi:hypothetical protein